MFQGIDGFIKTDHMRTTSALMITILCYSLFFIYNIDNSIMDKITIFEKMLIIIFLYCSVWFTLSCLKMYLNYKSKMKRINGFWYILERSLLTIEENIKNENIEIHKQCFHEADQPLYYLWVDKRLLKLFEINTGEITVAKIQEWIVASRKIKNNQNLKPSNINKEEESLYLEIMNSLSIISQAPNLKANMIEEWEKYGEIEKPI
jgi:hypothetical protein